MKYFGLVYVLFLDFSRSTVCTSLITSFLLKILINGNLMWWQWGAEGVLGQNGSGQNGTDKMVWTKWYTDKMALDKMVWTKWHGQNGTDKILRIKSSTNPAPIDNMIYSSIPLPL